MKLEDMRTKELPALHNRIADKPAGPKTFATRAKIVARIEQIAAAKDIDLAASGQPKKPKATAKRAQPKADAAKAPEATEKKPRGKGIGALARAILMDPAGYPHGLIAVMVNAQWTALRVPTRASAGMRTTCARRASRCRIARSTTRPKWTRSSRPRRCPR